MIGKRLFIIKKSVCNGQINRNYYYPHSKHGGLIIWGFKH
nr:MAG TPA: hypothetical protein [Caudoviricetes sp.]